MRKSKKEKMLNYLDEVREAIEDGKVNTLLIAADEADSTILHGIGDTVTLIGLAEIQKKEVMDKYDFESKKAKLSDLVDSMISDATRDEN